MVCCGLALLQQLLKAGPIADAKADLEGFRLNGQSRLVSIALKRTCQDWSFCWIFGRQHLKCNEHAYECDIHFPVRQMRAGTHARTCSKGEVLCARSIRDTQEPLWGEFVGILEMVRIEVCRPGVLDGTDAG
jgi:hypothetical protein